MSFCQFDVAVICVEKVGFVNDLLFHMYVVFGCRMRNVCSCVLVYIYIYIYNKLIYIYIYIYNILYNM